MQDVEVSRVTKSHLFEIINNSFVERLVLMMLPLNLQRTVLSSVSNLKHLTIDSYLNHTTYSTVDLPNLEVMDCVGSECVLNSIGQHKIKSLKISFIKQEILEFLEKCNALKDLTLWGFDARHDREFQDVHLESLIIETSTADSIINLDWNINSCRKFFNSQKGSLKNFSVIKNTIFHSCDEMVVYVLNNMSLINLHVEYSIDDGIVHKLNEELQYLRMDCEYGANEATTSIIACAPNVLVLDILTGINIFDGILPLVNEHMSILKHLILTVDHPEDFNSEPLQFKNLQVLDTVFLSEHIQHFIKLISCCPLLTFIRYNMPQVFIWQNEDFREFLYNIPNVLEILSVGNFGLNEVTLELLMLHENTLRLEKFKFVLSPFDNFLPIIDIRADSKIRFIIEID